MSGVSVSSFLLCLSEVCHPICCVDHSSKYSLDTPWDEPSENSFEFCAYVNGEIFDKDPWNRLSPTVLSKLFRNFHRLCRTELGQVYSRKC